MIHRTTIIVHALSITLTLSVSAAEAQNLQNQPRSKRLTWQVSEETSPTSASSGKTLWRMALNPGGTIRPRITSIAGVPAEPTGLHDSHEHMIQGNGFIEFLKRLLAHRQLPLWVAVGAILAMVPALKTGLIADDVVQRAFQFKATESPAHPRELFPPDPGTLHGVLSGHLCRS